MCFCINKNVNEKFSKERRESEFCFFCLCKIGEIRKKKGVIIEKVQEKGRRRRRV